MPVFADFRLKKELESLDLLPNSSIEKIPPENHKFYTTFKFTIQISKGIYSHRTFIFLINLYEEYPFRPPKILCKTKIFHPNIDDEGHVCINIVREDWSCAIGIQSIILGIYILFFEFDGENSLNQEAGNLLKNDYQEFVKRAQDILFFYDN